MKLLSCFIFIRSLFLYFWHLTVTRRMEILEVIHILEKQSKERRQKEIYMRTSHYKTVQLIMDIVDQQEKTFLACFILVTCIYMK